MEGKRTNCDIQEGWNSENGWISKFTWTWLLPAALELYKNTKSFVWVHDNAPCHKSKKITKFLTDQKVQILPDYPANSPDLNPIENIWSLLKAQIAKSEPKNLKTLVQTIKKCWESLPLSTIRSTIESWPHRLQIMGVPAPPPPLFGNPFFLLNTKMNPKTFLNNVSKNPDSFKYDLPLFLHGISQDSIGDI